MREILFRGKREDNGKWVEGASIIVFAKDEVYIPKKASRLDVIHDTHSNLTRIENTKMYKVDVSTIGQYTGLTDNDGNKIFEGDIVNFKTIAYTFKKCVVKYDEQYARFTCIDFNKAGFPMDISFVYEIIGNIHDNPELLGVQR